MRARDVRISLVAAASCALCAAALPLAAQERARDLSALLAGRKTEVDGELRELVERADALARSRDAPALATWIGQARRAIGEARAAAVAGDGGAAGRAKQRAWAALSLAGRTLALRHAQAALALAERRAERAERALAAEQAALAAVEARAREAPR